MVLLLTCGCTTEKQNNSNENDLEYTGSELDKELEAVEVTFIAVFENGASHTKKIEVAQGTNALDAMKEALLVKTNSTAMGEYVTKISGHPAPENAYWKLEVNGEYADKGIGGYTIEKPVEFRWSIEEIK